MVGLNHRAGLHSNDSRGIKTMQDDNTKLDVSIPEECLFIAESEIDTSRLDDAFNTSISRAIAVLHFIQADGSNINDGFGASHKIIMDALWALDGNLREAKKILEVSQRYQQTV